MEDVKKKQLAEEFLTITGVGRDTFIGILHYFEANKDAKTYEMYYKGCMRIFNREDWMEDITNKRRFYEEVIGKKIGDIKEEFIEDEEEEIHPLELPYIKKIQTLRDKNIQLSKIVRDDIRTISKREELLVELKDAVNNLSLNLNDFVPEIEEREYENTNAVGILQLSDLHANEIIDEMGNKFDFEVLSRRLRTFVKKSCKYFISNGITKVYLLGTGDFINSNRRPSEKVNSATSRVRASLIVVKLLTYVIKELYRWGFDVAVAFCSSNESRIEEIKELDDLSASENFDILIYHMLKMLLEGKGVEFIDCNMIEGIVPIKEFNRYVIITHGTQYGSTDLQKKVQQTKGKFVSRGYIIDYVFSGNIHSAYISDTQSRSASLCGGNGFSDSEMNFDSRASQNCYLFYNDGSVDGLKIDLQNVGAEGYDISEELVKYRVKKIVE